MPQVKMRCFTVFVKCLVVLSMVVVASPAVSQVRLGDDDAQWEIDPETLAVFCHFQGAKIVISPGLADKVTSDPDHSHPAIEQSTARVSQWYSSRLGVEVQAILLQDNGLKITARTTAPKVVSWPIADVMPGDTMAWPLGQGVAFPASEPFWRKEIFSQSWDAAEALSMPLFGRRRGEYIVSWISESPFRHQLSFQPADQFGNAAATSGKVTAMLRQDFSELDETSHGLSMRFYVDRTSNILTPALHYRAMLKNQNRFRTMSEKAAEVPAVERLRGALFCYIWGGGVISADDILSSKWKPFCKQLLRDATTTGSVAASLKAAFTADAWQAVAAATKEEWVYDYLKKEIASGLANALAARGNGGRKSANTATQSGAETGIITPDELMETFPGVFRPIKEWGGGVSLRMLDALTSAGIDRARLCVPAHEDIAPRPWVAQAARDRGWLIGTYDSYHSVHSPDATTESTWATAQMTRELFESGSVRKQDGSFVEGFRGVGHILNSAIGRPFLEKRVAANFSQVPYNYYFLDCDATGQVFDDFSPGHRLSKQADAAERLERLRWISRNFVAAVGSEGGHSFASMAVDVGEGVMAPYFGWDDPSLKDRKSPFFRGAYYPPDEPAVFFKPVPLAERFEKVYFDPRYKIPLFNAALHDSIVVTAHWNNGAFKYEKLFPQRELLSLLYLQPLMFHLNLEEWARRSHDIRRYYEAWSPLHKRFGFAPQLNFQVLDPDGLVQQTTYGNDESTSVAERCVITVNLGKKAYSLQEGLVIPAMSAWIEAPSVWEKGRVFSAGQPAAKHD